MTLGGAKALFVRARRLGRRAWGFVPFSVSGLALATTIGLGLYFFGMRHSDHILLIAGICVLLLASIDAVLVILTAAVIGWRFRHFAKKDADQGFRLDLVTGIPAPSLRLMPRFLPPLIEASTKILNPPDFDCEWRRDHRGRREEWLLPGRRCALEENFRLTRRVIVKDVLGFCALDWEQEEPLSLRVLPKPLPLPSQSLISAWFRGDEMGDPRGEPRGDRVDMRPYAPGDPPRLLLWKIYARTGKLMVRMPENAITTAPRTCAFLVAGPGDEPVSSLARTLVERGLLGDGWCFGADGSSGSADQAHEALALIAQSGNPGVVSGGQLSAFLQEAAQRDFRTCLLLVPTIEGDWVDSVASSLSRSPLEVSLLTVGSIRPPAAERKWHRWVFYEERTHANPQDLFVRLNSSAVTDWLTFDQASERIVALRGRGLEGGRK